MKIQKLDIQATSSQLKFWYKYAATHNEIIHITHNRKPKTHMHTQNNKGKNRKIETYALNPKKGNIMISTPTNNISSLQI